MTQSIWNLYTHTQPAGWKLGVTTLKGKLVEPIEAKSPNFHFHV